MKVIKKIIFSFLLMYQVAGFAVQIDNVIVFGDSLSDTGNLYQFMNYQLPVSPPYYNGRFSDGPVWVELVTQYLSKDNAYIRMENYAFGGALVLEDDDFFPGVHLSLQSQVDAYLEAHPAEENQNNLYIILMGGNDYIGVDEDEVTPEKIEQVTSEMSHQALRLAKRGAKFILVGNLPELGKSPLARELGAEAALSQISLDHNAKIKQKIELLKIQNPDTHWIFFDIHHFFTDAFYHPEKYGFQNTETPCYDFSGYNTQLNPIMSFASNPKLLNIEPHNCDSYLFFDIVHPTKRGHEFTASLAFSAIKKEMAT